MKSVNTHLKLISGKKRRKNYVPVCAVKICVALGEITLKLKQLCINSKIHTHIYKIHPQIPSCQQ